MPSLRRVDILNIHCRCAHTSGGSGALREWFTLELQEPRRVTRVQIANRLDCCLDRGRNIRITIGPSKDYDPNEPLCLPEIRELSHQPGLQDYVCTGDLHEGKFVKISRAGEMNLCEVKIFTLQGRTKEIHIVFINTLILNLNQQCSHYQIHAKLAWNFITAHKSRIQM